MPLLQPEQTIRDTYEVERYLAEGAFAEVYRVRHKFLGRQAMKVFKRAGMTRQELDEMMIEAVLLSRMAHPNIVQVFDANTVQTAKGEHGYFTMENVPGGSLDKFWRSHGVHLVPVETVVDILKQVCRCLIPAHSADPPIIHRDIKPQNILIGYEADGLRARISDYGLAKQVNKLTPPQLAHCRSSLPKCSDKLNAIPLQETSGRWALRSTCSWQTIYPSSLMSMLDGAMAKCYKHLLLFRASTTLELTPHSITS